MNNGQTRENGYADIYVSKSNSLAYLYRVEKAGPISSTHTFLPQEEAETLGSLAVRALSASLLLSEGGSPAGVTPLSWKELLARLGQSQKTIYANVPIVGFRSFTGGSIDVGIDFYSNTGKLIDAQDVTFSAEEISNADLPSLLDATITRFVHEFHQRQP